MGEELKARGTQRLRIDAAADNQKVVTARAGSASAYYGGETVSATSNDGTLAAGSSLTISKTTFFLTQGTHSRFLVGDAEDQSSLGVERRLDLVENDGGPAKLGATNTFSAKQTGNAGADWLGGNVRMGRTSNAILPDFLWDHGNEKLFVRGLGVGDIGDAPDLFARRAGPDDIPEPHGDYTGPRMSVETNYVFLSLYGEAYGATATRLNGAQTLPAATLTVDSTTGFPSSGTIYVGNGQTVTYTGTTATTFTGCSGGTGAQADNAIVSGTDGDFDGASAGQGKQAQIAFRTTELQTRTARGSRIDFLTTPNGSDSCTTRMILGQDGFLGLGDNLPTARLHLNPGNSTTSAANGIKLSDDCEIYRLAANVFATPDDIQFLEVGRGPVVRSPDGTYYRLAPANGGGSSIWTAV